MNQTETYSSPVAEISVRRLIGIGLLTRLLVDTAVQLFFPFLPTIAAGLSTTTVTLGRLVSLRSATGLLSPLFGVLADRRGYRPVMQAGLLLGAVGYGLVGISSSLRAAALGMLLAGIGTFAFVPTIQAYISSRLPYQRRARGLAVLEYAWALSGIFGLFLVGLLIEATSWRTPFYILSGGLLIAGLLYGRMPAARPHVSPSHTPKWDASFFNLGENGRSAWASLAAQGIIMFAAMHLFISYGAWLEQDYALTPAALGRIALIMGIADLVGSGLVSLVTDRIGKRRSVLGGTAVALAGFLLLPQFNQGLTALVVGLVWVRFSFEFSLVSNMAVLSEQAPLYRAKMMTLGAAAALLGSTTAGLTGPWLFARMGVPGLTYLPAVAMSAACLLTLLLVREQEPMPAL